MKVTKWLLWIWFVGIILLIVAKEWFKHAFIYFV